MTRKTDILIVDDKTENLLAMENLLEDPEINIITAGSGNEALAKTFEHDFALIVLDVRMPDMDGFEAAELLRSREKTRNIPIIFVTAINKDDTHVFKGYEKGAVDYLFKPINPMILKSKIRVFVDLYRQRKTIDLSEKRLAQKHCQLTLSEEALRTSEERLRQAHKMEAMGVLAGGIAHDFNNIIAAVIGYTEMSLSHVSPDSRVHHNLTQVIKAGERARDLVQQILFFSQKRDLEKTRIDIRILVEEALDLIRASIPPHITITSHIAPNPAFVYADPTQIHQVVMNLCTNAAHAMEKNGGELKIDLHPLPSEGDSFPGYLGLEAASNVRLTISDTGTGIAEHILKRIFEPYFTTKASGQGSGMGLAVVHGIVRSCNGAIDVISEPGHGSRVDIYFPEADAEEDKVATMGNEEHAAT